jgi:hypothetical protein
MATVAKKVNFTNEQEAKMRAEYLANKDKSTVEKLALEFGKGTRSIVAKLSSMGIYEKTKPVTKSGNPAKTKAEIVDCIEVFLGDGAGDLSSLESASKQALYAIVRGLKAVDIVEAD